MADARGLFARLEDEAFFVEFVYGHFQKAPQEAAELFPCENVVAKDRVELAYKQYAPSIERYKLLLDSENPDQYKRSGALLHCLYKSRIVTAVQFAAGVFGSMDDIESAPPLALSYHDCEHYLKFPKFYKDFHNEIISFDLAYRCCSLHEDNPVPYTFNYLENVSHYLHSNDNLNIDSLSMLFRSLMHQPIKTERDLVKASKDRVPERAL